MQIGVVALVRERGKKENDESYKKRMATVESFNAGKFRISVHCYQNQKDIRILMYHLHNRTVGMFPRSVSRVSTIYSTCIFIVYSTRFIILSYI